MYVHTYMCKKRVINSLPIQGCCLAKPRLLWIFSLRGSIVEGVYALAGQRTSVVL